MMKKLIGFSLMLAMIFSMTAYPAATETDESPITISWINTRWDYRDYGNFGMQNWTGGSQLRNGAVFLFECILNLGGLDLIEDKIRVVAVNTVSKKRYKLHYEPFYWPPASGVLEYWALAVQPNESMFEGEWKFIVHGKDSDGNRHRQVDVAPAPQEVFPADIGHVTVKRSGGAYEVCWSGIGAPNTVDLNYRVLVIETATSDIAAVLVGKWQDGNGAGTYDLFSNKVTFTIPPQYAGDAYAIRLANILQGNKALYYLVLPNN